MKDSTRVEILVLGGGLAGLAAGACLGSRASVLEKDDSPGGLVKTACLEGWWFDHVLHLLHVQNQKTLGLLQGLLPGILAPCPPLAWVETEEGVARFPIQLHLEGLSDEAKAACLIDLAQAHPQEELPKSYEELLLASFGQRLCDLFFFPYNRKMWRRPLSDLAPSGFQWNIARPSLEEVTRGAMKGAGRRPAYNENSWYPRPEPSSPVRGMEVLSKALAGRVTDLRLGHEVLEIDAASKRVLVSHGGSLVQVDYDICISTLPLPSTLARCSSCPEGLRERLGDLSFNSVVSVMCCLEGPRPEGKGLWRYFPREDVSFTRLIYPHEFDPLMAPENGWGVMAEIPTRSDEVDQWRRKGPEGIERELALAGALPSESKIVGMGVRVAHPAYVVFTPQNQPLMEEAKGFLAQAGILPLGRYGRWEYSSMAQVIQDGFDLAESLGGRCWEASPF